MQFTYPQDGVIKNAKYSLDGGGLMFHSCDKIAMRYIGHAECTGKFSVPAGTQITVAVNQLLSVNHRKRSTWPGASTTCSPCSRRSAPSRTPSTAVPSEPCASSFSFSSSLSSLLHLPSLPVCPCCIAGAGCGHVQGSASCFAWLHGGVFTLLEAAGGRTVDVSVVGLASNSINSDGMQRIDIVLSSVMLVPYRAAVLSLPSTHHVPSPPTHVLRNTLPQGTSCVAGRLPHHFFMAPICVETNRDWGFVGQIASRLLPYVENPICCLRAPQTHSKPPSEQIIRLDEDMAHAAPAPRSMPARADDRRAAAADAPAEGAEAASQASSRSQKPSMTTAQPGL